MYTIAICDDEQVMARHIAQCVMAIFDAMHRPVSADWYCRAEELEKRISTGTCYDVLLLDIDMPSLDGIELCRRIRRQGSDALVVFISNKEELVFQTFEVFPFRFVRKTHFDAEIERLCADLDKELQRRADHWLRFQNERDGTVYSININKLMYVEASGKICRMVSLNDTKEIRTRLLDLTKKLSEFGFVMSHRSYLVNPYYIYAIEDDNVILDNGVKIPLSRNRRQDTREEFFRWTREH